MQTRSVVLQLLGLVLVSCLALAGMAVAVLAVDRCGGITAEECRD